jgi:hypothetical protein
MKSFNQFLIEARRNPEKNVKQFPVKALEKYKDDDDIFITFIQNAKSFTETGKDNYLAAQVGLNTKSRYNTPNGIYTYPMVEVFQQYVPGKGWKKFNVPFAGDMPKIGVLRRVGKNYIDDIGSGEYSNAKLAGDTEKIAKYTTQKLVKILGVKNEYLIFLIVCATIRYAFTRASNDLPGMQFWNASRLCAALIALAHQEKTLTGDISSEQGKNYQGNFRLGSSMPKMSAWWIYGEKEDLKKDYNPDTPKKIPSELLSKVYTKIQKMKGNKAEMTAAHIFEPSGDKKEKGKSNPYANAWAVLLIQIGYDSIADRGGKRVIHPAEPTQAVFLARRGYKVLEIIENRTYEDRKPVLQIYRELKTDEEKANFLQKIENDGITQGQESVRLWRFLEKLKSNNIIVNSDVLEALVKKEPHTATEFYRTGHSVKVINELMKIGLKEKASTLTVYVARGPECKIQPETIIFGLEELFRQKTEKNPKSINSPLLDIRQSLRMYENKWNKQNEDVIQAFRKATKKAQDDATEYLESEKSK